MSDGFQSNETGKTRFDQAIERIDAVNKTDPRVETAGGRSEPRELAFARRVTDWVRRLADDPSEALLLAARGHTIGRWRIPRDRYPATTLGYHEWRDALARMHAEETARICREAGYGEDVIRRVSELITRKRFPDDAEARVMEDADCLVFLETKLAGYVDEWGEKKTLRILRRTVAKMTPDARKRAMALDLPARESALLRTAAAGATAS